MFIILCLSFTSSLMLENMETDRLGAVSFVLEINKIPFEVDNPISLFPY